MSCPACEQNRLAGRKFCTQCGASLVTPEPPVEPELPVQQQGEWQTAPVPEAPKQPEGEWQTAPVPEAPKPEVPVAEAPKPEIPVPEAPKQQTPEPEVPQQQIPVPETPKAAAAAPVSPVPEKPKKKANKPAIALIAVIVALLAAAAVLFATGVISFGGDKADKEDTEETDKDDKDNDEDIRAGDDAEAEDDGSVEIYSDKDYVIRFRGMEEDDEEYRFLISMENKTDEHTNFSVYIAGVNGYALPDMAFSAYDFVEGGDTRNTRITLPKSEYEVYQLGDIELMTFNITIAPDGGSDYVEEMVSFRLDGKDPGDYEPPERRTFTNEQTVIDQDDVLLTVGSPFKSEYWEDLCIMVYFENRTDDSVQIEISGVKANGQEIEDGGTWITMPANSVGYTVLTIDAYDLEDLGLTVDEVTEVSADLEAEFWSEYDPFFTGSTTYAIALEE